jgi:hypothetical protein
MSNPGEVLSQLALEEGRSALAEQVEALERLRTRATGYVATVLAVVGFVVGQQAPSPDGGFEFALALWALIATAGTAVLAVSVLWPRRWNFTLNASTLANGTKWRESDDPRRDLADFLGEFADTNDAQLGSMHTLFLCELTAGAIAIVTWLVLTLVR